MRFLLFPFMLAAAMCLAPAQELPALKWNARDQQSLMKGTWWEANAPLLPPVDAAVAPSASVPEPSANADSPAVDPVPEDFTDVNEYFLPDYIRTSTGLIDPQKLLTEVESNDVIELIKLIKSRYIDFLAGVIELTLQADFPVVFALRFYGRENVLVQIVLVSKGTHPLLRHSSYPRAGYRERLYIVLRRICFSAARYQIRFNKNLGIAHVEQIDGLVFLLKESPGNTILVV